MTQTLIVELPTDWYVKATIRRRIIVSNPCAHDGQKFFVNFEWLIDHWSAILHCRIKRVRGWFDCRAADCIGLPGRMGDSNATGGHIIKTLATAPV